MPDHSVTRALEQIEAIHAHLARGEVYRGWQPVPVAMSGVIGLAAGAWQAMSARPADPWSFTTYWLGVATVSLVVGCSEIAWHYVRWADESDRRRTRQVLGQFLPALVAGAIVTGALVRLNPALATLLPGLWALFFGVGIFSARPFLPPVSVGVALYFWTAGLALLWTAGGVDALSPWSVGGTFGVGQLLGALALHFRSGERDQPGERETHDTTTN